MKQGSTIDWADVRKRVKAAEAAVEAALHPSDQTIREAFEERARRLAGRTGLERSVDPGLAVLVVGVANAQYGVELRDVAGVAPLRQCTPVPGGPPELVGVISQRGEAYSVIDAGRALGRRADAPVATGFVLHLRARGREARVRVDAVDEIVQVLAGELNGIGQSVAGLPVSAIRGITSNGLIVLHTETLLGEREFTKDIATGATASPAD